MEDIFDDSQRHNVGRKSTMENQSDDEHIPQITTVFEQQAGTIATGCRNTIDSVLSNYGSLRDEIQQNPRIGLVLSTEFNLLRHTETLLPTFSTHTLPGPGLNTDELPPHHGCQNAKDESFENSLKEIMVDIPKTSPATYVHKDGFGLRTRESSRTECESSKIDTDAKSSNWDDLEDTLLDVYASMEDDFFPATIQTAATDDEQVQRLGMSNLGFSPIIQIAMIEPFTTYLSDIQESQSPSAFSLADDTLVQQLTEQIPLYPVYSKTHISFDHTTENQDEDTLVMDCTLVLNKGIIRGFLACLKIMQDQAHPTMKESITARRDLDALNTSHANYKATELTMSQPTHIKFDDATDNMLHFLMSIMLFAVAVAGRLFG